MSAARVVGILGPVVGLTQLLLGVSIWFGVRVLLPVHILVGLTFAVLLGMAAWIGARSGHGRGRVALTAFWAVFLPVFGIMHGAILPGGWHVVVQVLHAAVGLYGIGLIRVMTEDAPVRARPPATAGA